MSNENKQPDLDSSTRCDSITESTWQQIERLATDFLVAMEEWPYRDSAWNDIDLCPDIFDEDLASFLSRQQCCTTFGTQAPLISNQGEYTAAALAIERIAEVMDDYGALYLFVAPGRHGYETYLQLIHATPQLRLKSIGVAKNSAAETELVVLQAESVAADDDLRKALPFQLPTAPHHRTRRDLDHALWFYNLAKSVLSSERRRKEFADPMAGDYSLMRAAHDVFEETPCGRESRPEWVKYCRALGLYVAHDLRPMHELELFRSGVPWFWHGHTLGHHDYDQRHTRREPRFSQRVWHQPR